MTSHHKRPLAKAAVIFVLCLTATAVLAGPNQKQACWGQATKVFAQTGVMGEHASQEPTPRMGLHNLAEALYEAGILPDASLQSLGKFVADELGLSIEACNFYP